MRRASCTEQTGDALLRGMCITRGTRLEGRQGEATEARGGEGATGAIRPLLLRWVRVVVGLWQGVRKFGM